MSSTLLETLRAVPPMTKLEVYWLDASDVEHTKPIMEVIEGDVGTYVKDVGYFYRVEKEGKFGKYHVILSHNVVNGYAIKRSTAILLDNIVGVSLQETARILWQHKEALRAIKKRKPRRFVQLVE